VQAKGKTMSATGLEVFDKTVQTTNGWLKEIEEFTGPDRRRAYRVLAAVLHVLRDRLTVDEAVQLGAQLPILVRGFYIMINGITLPGSPNGCATRMSSWVRSQPNWTTSVLSILRTRPAPSFRCLSAISPPGEIEHVKATLPAHIRELWP
jgi:uncharacterized protein (DUF2267 family)